MKEDPDNPIHDYLIRGNPTRDKVIEYLDHRSPCVRVNAIRAAAKLAREDDSLVEIIAAQATRAVNSSRFIFRMTVGYVAIQYLFKVGTVKATAAANKLFDSLSESTRSDIAHYMSPSYDPEDWQ